VEAAALRHGFIGGGEDLAPPPPFFAAGEPPPTRRSAHAEGAALRWREQHPGAPD
jgi:hypothetical protein